MDRAWRCPRKEVPEPGGSGAGVTGGINHPKVVLSLMFTLFRPAALTPGARTGSAPALPVAPGNAPEFPLGRLLDQPADYDTIYRVVRGAVRTALGIDRPGLGLALSDLPPGLGAYWQVTGNLIVLNESLVQTMRRHASSTTEFNSFVFVILAHEYLHALGYLDEVAVRKVTAQVVRTVLGPDHPATRMASGDLWQMYPFLQNAPQGRGRHFQVVSRFDLDTTSRYIR
jgi:hypothetical protein